MRVPQPTTASRRGAPPPPARRRRPPPADPPCSIIRLNNDLVLYLREVSRHLALVCLLRVENFERQGLLDYNFHCFRSAIHEVFRIRGAGETTGGGE